MAIVLAIAGGAWLFDYYHQGNARILDEIERSKSEKPSETILFYYNPAVQLSLKLPVARPLLKKIFYATDDKLVLMHHSSRAYHLLKAEPLFKYRPLWLVQHTFIFRHHYSHDYDDQPHEKSNPNLQG